MTSSESMDTEFACNGQETATHKWKSYFDHSFCKYHTDQVSYIKPVCVKRFFIALLYNMPVFKNILKHTQ